MTIGENSYGTTTGGAALTPRHADPGGDFNSTTRPTLAQAEKLIDQVSALVNSILAQTGFAVPVTNADVKAALEMFVTEEVAAIVEGINGSGRFGPSDKGPGRSRFTLIQDDVQSFIQANATGFERLGATRTYHVTAGILTRTSDASGQTTAPIFQREGFGNRFEDWDA
jgi:hypothetical protein